MKISQDKVETYRKQVSQWLALNAPDLTSEAVNTGLLAWAVAHRAGIVSDAYAISRDVYDSHIQTALKRIFPNAVFKDS